MQCVDKALKAAPSNHTTTARAYMLQCKALFLGGKVAAAEAAYAKAHAAALWHLGPHHPALSEMQCELARGLARVGAVQDAAKHLER